MLTALNNLLYFHLLRGNITFPGIELRPLPISELFSCEAKCGAKSSQTLLRNLTWDFSIPQVDISHS